MSQPPDSGHGAGGPPGRDPGPPGGTPGAFGPGPRRGRELRLGDFAQGGVGHACPPGPDLAVAVAGLSGPEWRCNGATDEEMVGLLGRWAALESWAAAGKLGVTRELIRRRGVPGGSHGDLPDLWEDDLAHEITPALGMSLPAADKLANTAWELQARLPGIGAALAAGTIDSLKAQLILKELTVLDDAHIAAAEAMILPELAGKTPGQLTRLAALAVATVDPEGARRRREHAEREDARVRLWREHTGASALAAYGLPTDAALSANANINQRAEEYKQAKICPDARMDQLRVLAFCDILNGISAAARIAQAQAEAQQQAAAQAQAEAPADPGSSGQADEESDPGNGNCGGGPTGSGNPHGDGDPADPVGGDLGDENDDPGDGDHGPGDGPGNGPGGGGPSGDPIGSSGASATPGTGGSGPALPARSNLTLPLATLLGLADRPGAAHGLGPLDPALVRDLAAAAARSPHSDWCLTITDDNGYAIGHGCAKLARTTRKRGKSPPAGSRDGPWTFTRQDDPGPPDGFGTWLLTLPDGRQLTVKLGPIPVTECDHRYESHGYQPSDTLRHLVEIRDGTCTFPPCSRHARNCDFEHAVPYDQGGRTCACNAGARSRRCHKVKQSKGWKVTQPRPGWHQWTAPSGRTYTQGPMKYPT
jgi:Domain of unknown function (DUF222)